MSNKKELSDEEIERIHDEGTEAGDTATTFHSRSNPYPKGSEANDIWASAFRNAYAKSIGR